MKPLTPVPLSVSRAVSGSHFRRPLNVPDFSIGMNFSWWYESTKMTLEQDELDRVTLLGHLEVPVRLGCDSNVPISVLVKSLQAKYGQEPCDRVRF